MIELDPDSGAMRVDDDGLAALLSGPDPDSVPLPLVRTLREPDVALELVVAGNSALLRHRVFAAPDQAVAVLGVRPGLHQVMALPPGHVAAALVRLTRLRPRRTTSRDERTLPTAGADSLLSDDVATRRHSLGEVGADVAWRLAASWSGDRRQSVTAIDGPDGLFWADATREVLAPVSNTSAYRAFATVLTAGEPTPAQ